MVRLALASAALVVPLLALGADQTLLGKSLVVKSPPGTSPGLRKIVAKAVDAATVSGDPTVPVNSAGGMLEVFVDGAVPGRQTFTLPQGTARDGNPFWRAADDAGFDYVDRYHEHGPVEKVRLRRAPNGTMRLGVKIRGAAATIAVAPPNPGTSGSVTLALVDGDRYCVRFGPDAVVRNRDDRRFAVTKPASEGCPLLVEGEVLALSYNVAGLPQGISGSDPEINMPLIAPLLNGYDVVVLQETWKTPDPNPFAPTRVYHEILEAGSLHPFKTLSATQPLGNDPFRPSAILADGLNTFSRSPFGDVIRVPWATCWESAADCLAIKGFSVVRMTLAPGATVDVYDLHMEAGSDPEDDVARDQGITQLSDFIQAHSAGRPVIVGGDFNLHTNSEPDSTQFQRLLSETGLQDVCAALSCPEPGRIDKWLFRSGAAVTITPLSWRFETDVFVRDGDVPLSDHEALAVRFAWAVAGS
jgi:endonuclease/exonuclease/phosphatase family metal-dependent hydrolase